MPDPTRASAIRSRPLGRLSPSRAAGSLVVMGAFTAALLDALLAIGVPLERARTVVDLLDRSVDERYGLHAQVLATKRDVAELETRLVREVAETNARIAECNTRIAECSARIAEARSDLARWMLAAVTAQTALVLAAIKLF